MLTQAVKRARFSPQNKVKGFSLNMQESIYILGRGHKHKLLECVIIIKLQNDYTSVLPRDH